MSNRGDAREATMRIEVGALLGPGESLVGLFTTVRAAPGTPEPPAPAGPLTSGGPLRFAGRGLFRAAGESERLVGNAMGRALHGQGLHGGQGSVAAALVRALAPHGAPLAVTGHRLLVLHGRSALGTAGLAVVWELSRGQVREARATPRGVVQRGRVEVSFTDASWAALVTVPPRDASALAAALTAGP